MPKTSTVPQIEFRLPAKDHVEFDGICRVKGKKRSELAREAVTWYLENHEKQAADSRETLLEKRMRKMEERMAALQARTAIDVGMIYMIMYRNMDHEERDQVVVWAYNNSIARLKKKLEGQAAEVKEQMQKHED
jgi:metal-responsive CopG/Arc/MetJ family transcriptional regulator